MSDVRRSEAAPLAGRRARRRHARRAGGLLAGDDERIRQRFDGRLQFGTAGLRAAVGAGPQRMNRLVVHQAAAGLVDYLLEAEPDAATRGVIIGYDARRKSDVFALDTARVCAARGVRAMIFRPRRADADARVEHHRSRRRGRRDGHGIAQPAGGQRLQGVSLPTVRRSCRRSTPRSRSASTLSIRHVSPVAEPDDPLIEWLDDSYVEAYLGGGAGGAPAPRARRVCRWPTPRCTASVVRRCVAAFERAGFSAPSVVPEQQEPDPAFPTVSFPNPEEPGAMDLLLAQAAAYEARDRALPTIPTPTGSAPRSPHPTVGWRRLHRRRDRLAAGRPHPAPHAGDDRLVITTLVSSSLLGEDGRGVRRAVRRDYTGFKWIGHTVLEQARSCVSCSATSRRSATSSRDRPLDKDGITAAVLMAEVAALAALRVRRCRAARRDRRRGSAGT